MPLQCCHERRYLWACCLLTLFGTQRLRAAETEGAGEVKLVLQEEVPVSLHPGSISKITEDESLQVDFSMEKSIWGSHSGYLYYTDRREHKVKQIDLEGVVTAVAGSGKSGLEGDGGPALSAALHSPGALWGDRKGQLYISDNGNKRLRCVNERGVINTVMQLSFPVTGMWGDLSGNLFISSGPTYKLWKFDLTSMKGLTLFAGTGADASSGDGGSALNAGLAYPNGIWGDAYGAIYVAEMLGSKIRKIDREGRISTVAGTGRPGFSGDGGLATKAQLHCPCDVWGDGFDRLYVPDMDNNRVRRIDPDGTIHTLAGTGARGMIGDGGPAANAALFLPKGVWVDRHGSVYISDTFNYRIRRVDEDGIISTFGKSPEASISAIAAKRSENLLRFTVHQSLDPTGDQSLHHHQLMTVANANQHSVLAVDLDNGARAELLAGGASRGSSGDGGLAVHALLNHPQGVCVSPDGKSLYIVDTGNARIRVVDLQSQQISTFQPLGIPPDNQFRWQRPSSCAATNTEVLVVDRGLHAVASVNVKTLEVTIVAGVIRESGCDERRLRCPYGISHRPGSSQLFVTDPCCPDAFVRQVNLSEMPLTAGSLAKGFEGTAEDRLTVYSADDENIWVTGIDDCDLEYISIRDGLRLPVEVIDKEGEPAAIECVLDLAPAPAGHAGQRAGQMYLLGVGEDGHVIVARANATLRSRSGVTLNIQDTVHAALPTAGAVGATRGFTATLQSRPDDGGTAQRSRPITGPVDPLAPSHGANQSNLTHFSRLFLAFCSGAVLLCCVMSMVLLYCFKIKHKGYGRMGGTIHYESRIGNQPNGKAGDASFPPCEMESMTDNISEQDGVSIGKIGF